MSSPQVSEDPPASLESEAIGNTQDDQVTESKAEQVDNGLDSPAVSSLPLPTEAEAESAADPATTAKVPSPKQPSEDGEIVLFRASKPYNPRRITPALAILKPLRAEEIPLLYSCPLNLLRKGPSKVTEHRMFVPTPVNESSTNKKRAPSAEPESAAPVAKQPRLDKRRPVIGEDVKEVAAHYNYRPNISREARDESPIIGLKKFNNWIKTVLINQYSVNPIEQQAINESNMHRRMNGKPIRPRLKVLDLGCGKGGDLNKWGKVGTSEYIGIDVAEVSVQQAAERYQSGANKKAFKANFYALDCFSNSISDIIPKQDLERPFDVVSMQFCMHYAFQSAAKARMMLENVSRHLRYGGMFLGTIPDAQLLLQRLDEVPADVEPPAFGNSKYKITFDNRDVRPIFGHRYTYYLEDAVDNVPEYVVQWQAFKDLAAEYGLSVVYYSTFPDLFLHAKEDPEFAQLMSQMRVVNAQGESDMNEDMWEAANIYVAFAFEKTDNGTLE